MPKQEFEFRKIEFVIHVDVKEAGEVINEINSQPQVLYPGKIKDVRTIVDNYLDQLKNASEQQEKAQKAAEPDAVPPNRAARRRTRPKR